MKRISQFLGLMAMVAVGGDAMHNGDNDRKHEISNEDIAREQELIETKYKTNLLKKGAREFNIDGKIVLARNYENAIRKARRV